MREMDKGGIGRVEERREGRLEEWRWEVGGRKGGREEGREGLCLPFSWQV